MGGKLRAMDCAIYPPAFNPWGADIVRGHVEDFKADVVITHWDIWVVGEEYAEEAYPWVPYFPVDLYPVPPRVVERAKQAYWPVVYSKFGLRAMREAGVECALVPHAVDLDIFRPTHKIQARRQLGFREDAFIIGMVGANKGYPSRKCIPEALQAFKEFHGRHDEAVLYLHTLLGTGNAGIDVQAVIDSLELPKGSVKCADPYKYLVGLPDQYMADVYNAINVLHGASMTEGFGLPLLEAQACGTRVVTTDFAAMPENTFDGIVTEPAQLFWTQLDSWAAMPSVANILDAWERLYAGELGDTMGHSHKAIEGAQPFAWPVVLENHWKPFLEQLAERLERDKAVTTVPVTGEMPDFGRMLYGSETEAEPTHVHRWAPTGWYVDGVLYVPCLDKDCQAEMRVLRHGQKEVHPTGFTMARRGIALDIEDDPDGGVSKVVFRELESSYHLDDIPFGDGDVVLDIGAHVGVVSVYLAKLYPSIRVFAFEPVPVNYGRLIHNIETNGVQNVTAIEMAVTADGRELTLWGNLDQNSGGASALVPGVGKEYVVASMTLEQIFERFIPGRCKLLKMDVEGMEYEIIAASNDLLKRVDYLALEAHMNSGLAAQKHTVNGLKAICASYIPEERLRVCVSRMADGQGG